MDPWVRSRKFDAIKKAEAGGNVADSMEYRMALIKRMDAGERAAFEPENEANDFYARGEHLPGVTR